MMSFSVYRWITTTCTNLITCAERTKNTKSDAARDLLMKYCEGEQNVRRFFPRIEVVVLLVFLAFQEWREVICYTRTENGKRVKKRREDFFAQHGHSHTSKSTKHRSTTRSLNPFLSLFPPTFLKLNYQDYFSVSDKKRQKETIERTRTK